MLRGKRRRRRGHANVAEDLGAEIALLPVMNADDLRKGLKIALEAM